jgi:Peptidase family M48
MVSKAIPCAVLFLLSLTATQVCLAASKVKIRGYVTSRPNADTLQILDDVIHLSPATHFDLQNPSAAGAKPLTLAEVSPGALVEAEGKWIDHHQFAAEKITCDAEQFEREIHGHAYLQTEPSEADAIAGNQPAHLKADGELLLIDDKTKRLWKIEGAVHSPYGAPDHEMATRFIGDEVRYTGVRGEDGNIALEHIELGPRPPASAYRIPGDRKITRAHDPQTSIDVLEIRKGDKLEGRLKLFDVKEIQEYVRVLGLKLLPPAADVTARALEFRFYVVEDPSINAAALPDGTVLVNTGLLGVVENESQLAFVLSHEIAHVLQAHHWREANDTRATRVAIIIAAAASTYFVPDLGMFLGQLGLEAVVNGYSRRIENQADRLGLQNIIDLGYDPRSAVQFFHTMVEKYGRSSSAIWSNHDSNLMRGSFLTVQLARQYPKGQFDHAIVDTDNFKNMKEVMGPVKIM